MRTQFGYIFWGLIFVVLHFKINGFDILPDIIGYGMIVMGASRLAAHSNQFHVASSFSILLAIFWVIGLAITGDAEFLLGIVVGIANCAMMWSLLGGVAEFTTARNRTDLAESAYQLRVFYVAFIAGVFVFSLIARNSGAFGGLIAIVAVILMITLLVLIMRLIHRVRYEVADEEGSVTPADPAT
jgi:hypothetical protein